jgi:glutamyl endopeptidase
MSKATAKETVVQAREGKTYGYQRPPETLAADSTVADEKKKVVSAFDDFLDALAVRVGTALADSGGIGSAAGTSGTIAPSGGAGYSGTTGGGAVSAVPTKGGAPSTGTTGTVSPAPGGEKATSEAALKEALEMSIFAQREAYRLDRAREVTKRTRAREAASAPAVVGAAILGIGHNKHQSDSNRAPLTESKEFAPRFGSSGKSAAPTIEKMSVPSSQRPETVPQRGVVSAARPIDAYWGSFGTAIERATVRAKLEYRALEVILGTDDRVRVTNNELYPWRCISSLLITANTGAQYIGTGWLVSPRMLLTAGHCVYMSDEGGWVTQIEVIPGRNGEARPFGSAVSRDFRSVSGWTQDGDSDYDYGAVILPADKRYGDQLGWFGYACRPDDYMQAIMLNLSGYPGDGGKAPNQVEGSQWFHSRTVKDVLAKQITYEIDTYGGQSGAPVWEMTSDGSRYGVAVHTWGTTVSNGGTRITGEVFDNIMAWVGQAS